MKHFENVSEIELSAKEFAQQVVNNSIETLRQFRELQNRVRYAKNITSSFFVFFISSSFIFIILNQQFMTLIAQIVTQTIQNQSSSSYLAFVINFSLTSTVVSITLAASRFEKLSNILEYESDRKHLNAWEQNLIQYMNINHDRYFIDRVKIVYAKSSLIMKKKAHNLMNQYRVNELCVLTSFDEWRRNLRPCYENSFEVEDARTYLRETLKQDSLSFAEYYNLFYQKKKRSLMKNASLIDCMKRNVNYFTQVIIMSWRTRNDHKSTIFQEYAQTFVEINKELQQLKHRQSQIIATIVVVFAKSEIFSILINNSLRFKFIIVVFVVFVASVVFVMIDNFMNLSFVIIIVQDKTLVTSKVKEICNKWKLCYYCKLQHSSKIAKKYLNKKSSFLRLVVLDDTSNINEDVSLSTKKV